MNKQRIIEIQEHLKGIMEGRGLDSFGREHPTICKLFEEYKEAKEIYSNLNIEDQAKLSGYMRYLELFSPKEFPRRD